MEAPLELEVSALGFSTVAGSVQWTAVDGRSSKVSEPWDTLSGGEVMDLLLDAHRTRANALEMKSAVVHFSPSCKTFTRIREIPIPGASRPPVPLRSEEHPLGLPFLKQDKWVALGRRVADDNSLAIWAIERCMHRAKRKLGFTLEHPGNSYIWELGQAKELLGFPEVEDALFHNCMFKDGRKRKLSRFRTDMPQVASRLRRWCSNKGGLCDRTGQPHASWRPKVANGCVMEFRSEMEAEFQLELAEQIAEGIAEFEGQLEAAMEWDFSEFFAGPNAPLSAAVRKTTFRVRSSAARVSAPTAAGVSAGSPSAKTLKATAPAVHGMVKLGKWGNSLVQAELVKADAQTATGRWWCSKPRQESGKAVREQENRECVGGLRSPWKDIRGNSARRLLGEQIRAKIVEFIEADPSIVEDLLTGSAAGYERHRARVEGALVPAVASVLGTQDLSRGPRSKWRASMVEAFVGKSEDQEVHLAGWLRCGAPTGVAQEIPTCGIFPTVDKPAEALQEMHKIFARSEAHRNYVSVHDNSAAVLKELGRLTGAGFMTKVDTWAELSEQMPEVVVNKMACILKTKDDGSVKLRLITDMLRSGVNAFVKLHERIVLPRLCDAVEALLGLLEQRADATQDVELLVSDFSDAFHTLGVHETERKHQVVVAPDGTYRIYETVVFGGGGSPLVWGRAAAFLGRSGQALFSASEARMEIFVDDPWSAWLGTRSERRRNMVTLLLWWTALGLDIAWHKIAVGDCVRWIGADVAVSGKDLAIVSIPARFCSDLEIEARRLLGGATCLARDLRKFAGRCSWAGGIVPCMASLLQQCWAALADVDTSLRDCGNRAGQSSSSRARLLPADLSVPTVRIAHALEWIIVFATAQRGALKREFSAATRRKPFGMVITVDASPWGYGGFIMTHGRCLGFFSEEISKEDIQKFGIVVGEARFQALLENMALLIAVRMWAALWVKTRLAVCLRSDSMAAVGAWAKERSSNTAINMITRELCLDLAEGKFTVDRIEHLPGSLNTWADALSRQFQPGNTSVIPSALLDCVRCEPVRRSADWWQLELKPSELIGGGLI